MLERAKEFLQASELALEKGLYNGYSWLVERRRKRLTGEFASLYEAVQSKSSVMV
jgi:hypothetical protein